MNSNNPIVQPTVKDTLNEMVNSLTYITTTLGQFKVDDDTEQELSTPTQPEVSGLNNLLHCIKEAGEACYSQYLKERSQGVGS